MTAKRFMTSSDARHDHWLMLRFMAWNAAFGVFLGVLIAALLMLFDIGGLGSRIARAETPLLPILLIAIPLALTFGAAVAASAIWMLPYESRFRPESEKTPDNRSGDGDLFS